MKINGRLWSASSSRCRSTGQVPAWAGRVYLCLSMALLPLSDAVAAAVQGETDDPAQAAVVGFNASKTPGGAPGVRGEGWVGVAGSGATAAGGLGVYGIGAIGVQGETGDPSQPGVYGLNTNTEVAGTVGVLGRAYTGVAGIGSGTAGGVGVQGRGSVGVQGETEDPAQAGVRGVNGAQGSGIGVFGEAFVGVVGNSADGQSGIGVQGKGAVGVEGLSVGGRGVSGLSQGGAGNYGHSVSGPGVQGESDQFEGVSGISHNPQAAGVAGRNPGGLAGYFDGNVEIKGDIALPGGDVEARIAALEGRVAQLTATVARMSQLMDWQMPPVFGRPIPQIGARLEREKGRAGMVVTGSGFMPGAKVRIRITDNASFRTEGKGEANTKGELEPSAYVEIPLEKSKRELFVIATDEREDLHNLTGVLWSNTTPRSK